MRASIPLPTLIRRPISQEDSQRRGLMASLSATRAQLQQAYAAFNQVCDQDLVESCVFEIKALQARYDYLLRQVKALEGQG